MEYLSLKGYNFDNLENETDVRELIINPIINFLGYDGSNQKYFVKREKTFKTSLGSKDATLFIDYFFKVGRQNFFIIEVKQPKRNIKEKKYINQANTYASAVDIKAKYFCITNGFYFDIYQTNTGNLIFEFDLKEIFTKDFENQKKFVNLLSPTEYEKRLEPVEMDGKKHKDDVYFDYPNVSLPKPITIKKQSTKRHFGVHAYFTRQSWDIIQHYVKTFTKKGDIVLDPFCGTGTTFTESIILQRKSITLDINPLASFMTYAKLAPVNIHQMQKEFDKIVQFYIQIAPKDENDTNTINHLLEKHKQLLPKNINMVKGSDREKLHDFFTPYQMSCLVLLKSLILQTENQNIKQSLLLAFSSSLTSINLSFDDNTAAFKYYRYRIAPRPKHNDVLSVFKNKFRGLLNGKKEIQSIVEEDILNDIKYKSYKDSNLFDTKANSILLADATDLSFIKDESIDYVYTDPPYGKHIQYLDLSVMWNAWLGFDVEEEDYAKEVIQGGHLNKDMENYYKLILENLKEIFRVLKYNRWFSIVFQHKDINYWYMITDTAKELGFDYAGYVKQNNSTHPSFKKVQNPNSVFGGQMIINFFKSPKKTALSLNEIFKKNMPSKPKIKKDISDLHDYIVQIIENTILYEIGATFESITNSLQMEFVQNQVADVSQKKVFDYIMSTLQNDYDLLKDKFYIQNKFKIKTTTIERVKYFLYIYLLSDDNKTFDNILSYVIPKSSNGVITNKDIITKCLDSITYKTNYNTYELRPSMLEEEEKNIYIKAYLADYD